MKKILNINLLKFPAAFLVLEFLLFANVYGVTLPDTNNFKNTEHPAKDTSEVLIMLKQMRRYSSSDPKKAFQTGKLALEIAGKLNFRDGEAKSLNELGILSNMRGDIKGALEYYKKALKIWEESDNKQEIAGILSNIGEINFNLGNYPEALEYFLKSLSINEKLSDSIKVAGMLNEIGSVYLKEGDYKTALNYYTRALNIRRKTGPGIELSKALNNIGALYYERGYYEKSLIILREALDLQIKSGTKNDQARTLNNIGLNYLKLKNYPRAIGYFNRCLQIWQNTGNQLGVAEVLNNLGISHKYMRNYGKSIKYSEESLKIASERGARDLEKSAYRNLASTYVLLNNFKKAYEYQSKFSTLSDSLFNVNKLNQISGIHSSYESDKEEMKIELQKEELKRQRQFIYLISAGFLVAVLLTIFLLKVISSKQKINNLLNDQKNDLSLKQKIINEKNNELEESNSIKNKLFTIIAHDLRGPISTLKNMLDLLQTNDLTEKEFKELIDHLDQRVGSTRVLLDNLLNWALLQQDGNTVNPEKINLKNIADENLEIIRRAAFEKKIKLINGLNDDDFAYADPDMVKLVLRNLLTNAVKFTDEGGEISLDSVPVNGKIEIAVRDSGIGIDEDKINNLFNIANKTSTPGTKGETGFGLGLGLCRDFIEKNGGKIWAESKPGKGSAFKFILNKFPENKHET